jgi:pyrimidine operon attenuation protein/uracil phosphoribosyltransferase
MEQSSEKVVLREGDIQRALTRIAHEIAERNPQAVADPQSGSARAENGSSPSGASASASASHVGADLAIVGIHRRGAFLAQRLRDLLEDLLGAAIPLGDLDIGFYRDDVSSRPDAPVVHASHIDFDIAGRTVVIVDDVLFTGRTVRAAIEALFDYGRPERVQLAVLADRGHRELPIRPDYVGKNLPTSRAEHVHVRLRELDGVDEVAIAPVAVEVA